MEYHRQLEAKIEARKPYNGAGTGRKTGSIAETEAFKGRAMRRLMDLVSEIGGL
jgi:hypothetical protein